MKIMTKKSFVKALFSLSETQLALISPVLSLFNSFRVFDVMSCSCDNR